MRRSILVEATSSENGMPELVSRLLDFVEDGQAQVVVRVEAWNTLRAIAQYHFEVATTAWMRIDTALASDQNLGDIRVRSASMLFLEEYSKAGANALDPLVSLLLSNSTECIVSVRNAWLLYTEACIMHL